MSWSTNRSRMLRSRAILNDHFVPIKVDREERPDIDRIYMTALQAMGQNGGWPMSMFLTPDLRTVLRRDLLSAHQPVRPRGISGRPSPHPGGLDDRTGEGPGIRGDALALPVRCRRRIRRGSGTLTHDVLSRCQAQLSSTYDPVFGGFGADQSSPGRSSSGRCSATGLERGPRRRSR